MKEVASVLPISRNRPRHFAERTQKNLRYIQAAREQREGVHEVTQIVNSLLELVVFPWEKHFKKVTDSEKLEDLYEKG